MNSLKVYIAVSQPKTTLTRPLYKLCLPANVDSVQPASVSVQSCDLSALTTARSSVTATLCHLS